MPQWVQLREEGGRALPRLRTEVTVDGERFRLANAGMMGNRVRFGIFPRDLLTAGLIAGDGSLIRETVRFCARTIGCQRDPRTGEE